MNRFCLLLLIALFCYPPFSFPVSPHLNADTHTGLVLIHGTNDHRTDAVSNYWGEDYVAELKNSLPNHDNLLVVHCDFSQYMWDNAASACVAKQITDFIHQKNIHKLIVVTHSDGGNVIRWILSNPSFDARYATLIKHIQFVTAIAPSSAGTPLADMVVNGSIFEKGVGWLLGYTTNSVKQQRVKDMAIYNQRILYGTNGRPSLPVPFYTIVGTDVKASPFDNASYCRGYFYNVALKTTKLFLDDCADGFINCSSQKAAGQVWFLDKEKTQDGEIFSHNQSRYSCFGLSHIIETEWQ